MRWGGSQCWILEDPEDAVDCQQSGSSCGPWASGSHYYPFAGFAADGPSHNGKAWAAVHHATNVGLKTPVTLSQIQLDTNVTDPGGEACGLVPQILSTVSTVSWTNNCTDRTGSHEIGHNLNAEHCDGYYSGCSTCCDAHGCSIMADAGSAACPAPIGNKHRRTWFNDTSAAKFLPRIQDGFSPGTLRFGSGY